MEKDTTATDQQLEDGSGSVIVRLRKGEFQSIVVLAGAGISVNAGIPDFRSPGSGLYENLQKYNLPNPEAIFTLDYFRKNPMPFTLLANELWPTNFKPTITHLFVSLLEKKGMLLRYYTQNVDGLDRAAGISEDRLVACHGSFGSGHCIECKRAFDEEHIRNQISQGIVATCRCSGLVKPDITFFGEDLSDEFYRLSKQDFQGRNSCDLLICMGTSLQVEPVASLVHKVPLQAARMLINRELPRGFGKRSGDAVLLGDCDEEIVRLARSLGWEHELEKLRDECYQRLDFLHRGKKKSIPTAINDESLLRMELVALVTEDRLVSILSQRSKVDPRNREACVQLLQDLKTDIRSNLERKDSESLNASDVLLSEFDDLCKDLIRLHLVGRSSGRQKNLQTQSNTETN